MINNEIAQTNFLILNTLKFNNLKKGFFKNDMEQT